MSTGDLPGSTTANFVRAADGSTLEVVGEIDMDTVPELRRSLYELIDAGAKPVTVDMAGVSFIDSSGLGVLIGAQQRARELGGDVAIRNLNGPARKVFEITGLVDSFQIT